MTTATVAEPVSLPTGGPARLRWTRERFMRLVESGVLGEDDRIELVQGELYTLEPPGPFHSGSVRPIARMLEAAFGEGHTSRLEQPLVAGGDSQPQPDVAICVGTDATYRRRYPAASEVPLVVEVADSSLEYDRTDKLHTYARASIPEYWIVNLRENRLEVYRDPDPKAGEYRTYTDHLPGQTVSPLGAAGAAVSVSELLGL